MKKLNLLIICILAILLLTFTGCTKNALISSSDKWENGGTSMRNIEADGEYLLHDGIIYCNYINKLSKIEGNKITVLNKEITPRNIVLLKDTLFFTSNGDSKIYSIKIDGTGFKEILHKNPDKFTIDSNNIYYTSQRDDGLHVCKLNGESDKLISENVEYFALKDGKLYYIHYEDGKKDTLMTCNKDGNNKKQLTESVSGSIMFAYNKIFILQEYAKELYQYDLDGKNAVDTEIECFDVFTNDGILYYADEKEGDAKYEDNTKSLNLYSLDKSFKKKAVTDKLEWPASYQFGDKIIGNNKSGDIIKIDFKKNTEEIIIKN